MSVLSPNRPSAPGTELAPTHRPRTRRWLTTAVAGVLALALVGAGSEALLARSDAARHPAPGELVDVAGERLHVQCSGAGNVTVVLESGLADPASLYDPLRKALDDDTRVCAYDRPGHGWAGAPAGAQDPFTQADVLAAAFDGPLVVVGHSIGGGVARAFAARHPDRLAGVVLLDPTNTETLASTPSWLLAFAGGLQMRLGEVAGRVGLLRAFDQLAAARLLADAAPEAVVADAQHHLRPAVLAAARGELRAHRDAAGDLGALTTAGALGDVPLAVVSAASATEADREFHGRLAALSTAGRHLVAGRGGHHVHLDEPQVVTDVIHAVLSAR